jgi:large subunit ribosomal protein L32
MALPKRKISKSRGRKRRTHNKTEAITVSKCPACGDYKLPHNACPACGEYNGRTVIEFKEDEE